VAWRPRRGAIHTARKRRRSVKEGDGQLSTELPRLREGKNGKETRPRRVVHSPTGKSVALVKKDQRLDVDSEQHRIPAGKIGIRREPRSGGGGRTSTQMPSGRYPTSVDLRKRTQS